VSDAGVIAIDGAENKRAAAIMAERLHSVAEPVARGDVKLFEPGFQHSTRPAGQAGLLAEVDDMQLSARRQDPACLMQGRFPTRDHR
jgi:hypothetical protein